MFLSRNEKINIYPCKPQFYCIKVGFRGIKTIWACFRDEVTSVLFPDEVLRKHAYSNILKILQPKTINFQIKNSDIFHISAQNIDCGYSLEPPRRGGPNEYPQSMF